MARYKHYDHAQMKLLPISFDRQILPGTFEHTLSADTVPHFTTIFRNVLLVCDEAGLIGKEMFAIDGVRLPSNASKEWSGTKADLKKKAQKMQRAAEHLLSQHQANDVAGVDEPVQAAAERQIKTLNAAIDKVDKFLATHEDKIGKAGKPKQSNITDNDSAKMPTSKGVIQGYDGIALADSKHQVVVHAAAFGEGQEHGLLVPMLELSEDILKEAKLTADAGYSSEANAKYLFEHEIDGYVADNLFRKRDPRFESAERHKPTREDEPFAKPNKDATLFRPQDFQAASDLSHCICPAGQRLHRNGANVVVDGRIGTKFTGSRRACGACSLRSKCLRHPDRSRYRQVVFFRGFVPGRPEKYLDKMKRKIDSDIGHYQYSRRLGVIEPVFGNIRSTKQLNRFTLRGRRKVNAQWQMYCLVHNIGKIHRYGRLEERTTSRQRRAA